MTKRFKPPPPKPPGGTSEPDLPSLLTLDQFTAASLRRWRRATKQMEALHRALYFDLESLRQRDASRLIDAVRASTRNDVPIDNWCRIVDYRYSLEPLSTAGSVKNEGGRFNIGKGLSPAAFTAFPALYCAEDYPTAHLECFGLPQGASTNGLTGPEFALRNPKSFTQVRLRGSIESVIDVSNLDALKLMVEIIKEFQLPKTVAQTARQLGIARSPWMIRSAITLQRQLLHANWRMLPMQFDLPSNSQIFGRIVAAAGIHGILYPSARDSTHRCLALFPQNWAGSTSYVEVSDASPAGATVTRVDGKSRVG